MADYFGPNEKKINLFNVIQPQEHIIVDRVYGKIKDFRLMTRHAGHWLFSGNGTFSETGDVTGINYYHRFNEYLDKILEGFRRRQKWALVPLLGQSPLPRD
jgi:hypothetical protein